MLHELGVSQAHTILDPFNGVGTTSLTCRELGIRSVGVDVSPLFVFVSVVKTRHYDAELLRRARDLLFQLKFEKPEVSIRGFLRTLYPKAVLEDLLFFKNAVETIEDDAIRGFFILALMTAAEKSSYMVRDGAVVKVVKNKPRIPSFRKAFRRTVNMMIKDVEKNPLTDAACDILIGDARNLHFLGDECVDAVITSPPYLNKIEYMRCYWPEYEIFFPHIEHQSIRSYVGVRPDKVDFSRYSGEHPISAQMYFEDMAKAFGEMYRVLKSGGHAVVVVGGGVFPDRVIETDVALADIAHEIGFGVEKIVAVNKRVAAVDRVRRIGVSRESVLYLKK
ncbi:MAG: site-specific DNA-methyltransferase [Candidatus Caldarchaeum sp.]|nr:site-specific DNA-methyltransferase [Candidatus Caldarchaeum sp.]